MDIDPLIQLQMVRDRFIDGQAECALRRHLDSLGPDTPMADIVDFMFQHLHSHIAHFDWLKQVGTVPSSFKLMYWSYFRWLCVQFRSSGGPVD